MVTRDDHALARRLAATAGELLLDVREQFAAASAQDIRAAGDHRSHDYLAAELGRLRPHDAVLSEEGKDDPARLRARRVWIVDPLDGTWEFGEAGRADWAVHVALWESGELVAGAVALPAQQVVFATDDPPRLPHERGVTPRIIVSRTRAPALAGPVADELGAQLMRLGSAGAKAMAVVTGAADVYLHDGGQYEWDAAAPVVVASAAGLHASRIDGSPFTFNQPSPYTKDLLICRQELAAAVLDAVARQRRDK